LTTIGGPHAVSEPLQDRNGLRTSLRSDAGALTFEQVIDGLGADAPLRGVLLGELLQTPWPAFYWEWPPVTVAALGEPYQHVVLEGAALERPRPDPSAFRSQFQATPPETTVASFPNLGGDAILVAPKPSADRAYGHLGAFLRSAPADQQNELLTCLAAAIRARLADDPGPLWVSTAGLGVPWLHIRLDSRPKYYKYEPYRTVRPAAARASAG
jgi:hypothetical protein